MLLFNPSLKGDILSQNTRLKLKINFGRDLNGPIKIGGLYDSAIKLINNISYEDFGEESVHYGK